MLFLFNFRNSKNEICKRMTLLQMNAESLHEPCSDFEFNSSTCIPITYATADCSAWSPRAVLRAGRTWAPSTPGRLGDISRAVNVLVHTL